jgi:signal transduction histidine kinase
MGDPLDDDARETDRLAALGSLAAEIVHEIRNPLVSVKSFLDLLPEQEGKVDLGFLRIASEEVRRIERLLGALMQHARPSRDEVAACAVAPALESVAVLVGHRAAQREIALEVEVAADLPAVGLAPDALRQVLLNLTLNALDATTPRGDVSLSARGVGEQVEIAVSDRGPGVPAALRERVFEPFFSGKAGRAGGLGLAICRRLVEESGGSIEVGDRPGGGARFVLRLPRSGA